MGFVQVGVRCWAGERIEWVIMAAAISNSSSSSTRSRIHRTASSFWVELLISVCPPSRDNLARFCRRRYCLVQAANGQKCKLYGNLAVWSDIWSSSSNRTLPTAGESAKLVRADRAIFVLRSGDRYAASHRECSRP